MGDLTNEELAELRTLAQWGTVRLRGDTLGKLVDMAERCAKAEKESAATEDLLASVVDRCNALGKPFGDDLLTWIKSQVDAAKAAGELLRAAKDVLHNFHVDMELEHRRGFYGPQDVDAMHAMSDKIEAAERAGVKP